MNGQTLSAILIVLLGAPLVAVLNRMFGRKRDVAETEAIEVKATIDRIAGLWQDIGSLQERVDAQRQELDVLLRKERIQRRLLIAHEAWDHQAAAALRAAGIDLPDPPTLDADDAPDPRGARTRATDRKG